MYRYWIENLFIATRVVISSVDYLIHVQPRLTYHAQEHTIAEETIIEKFTASTVDLLYIVIMKTIDVTPSMMLLFYCRMIHDSSIEQF